VRFNTARTLFLILVLLNTANSQQTQTETAKRWSFYFEEIKIQSLQQRLSNQYQPSKLAFTKLQGLLKQEHNLTLTRMLIVKGESG
jgi:hypothetical protein